LTFLFFYFVHLLCLNPHDSLDPEIVPVSCCLYVVAHGHITTIKLSNDKEHGNCERDAKISLKSPIEYAGWLGLTDNVNPLIHNSRDSVAI
jgi:hypothetical protein